MSLSPSVELRKVARCSLPHSHSSVSRAINEVISFRPCVIAANKMSSRVSTRSCVATSSHQRLFGDFISDDTTAYQRSPPAGDSSSGISSRKVSLRMLWKTTLKYAAEGDDASEE